MPSDPLTGSLMFLRRNRGRAPNAAALRSGPEVGEASSAPDRQLRAIASLSSTLARARDEQSVARTLLEGCFSLLKIDFAGLAVVDEGGERGSGLLALARDGDSEWWPDVSLDFEQERSGLASAA